MGSRRNRRECSRIFLNSNLLKIILSRVTKVIGTQKVHSLISITRTVSWLKSLYSRLFTNSADLKEIIALCQLPTCQDPSQLRLIINSLCMPALTQKSGLWMRKKIESKSTSNTLHSLRTASLQAAATVSMTCILPTFLEIEHFPLHGKLQSIFFIEIGLTYPK